MYQFYIVVKVVNIVKVIIHNICKLNGQALDTSLLILIPIMLSTGSCANGYM